MAIKKITGNGVAESDMDIKKALTLSPCTCIADKEMTCIVHPTTRSLKDRIAELEKEQAAWRKFTNEANRTLDAADKKIAEQQQTIDRKDERIAELEAKIRRREAALDSFDAVERARQAENAKLREAARDVVDSEMSTRRQQCTHWANIHIDTLAALLGDK